jgi:hypothetical protein
MNSRIGVRGLSAMALVLAFVTVLLAVPATMPVSLARDATPGIDPATLYAHVHFIGASASAGFEVRAPIARGRQGWLEEMTLANVALSASASGSAGGCCTRSSTRASYDCKYAATGRRGPLPAAHTSCRPLPGKIAGPGSDAAR